MRLRPLLSVAVAVAVVAAACSGVVTTTTVDSSVIGAPIGSEVAGDSAPVTRADATANDAAREPITMSLTLYRLLNADGLGTERSTEEIAEIGERVNEVWAQAGIRFDPLLVRDIEVPAEAIGPIIVAGDIDPLLDSFASGIDVPDAGQLNGFYVSEAFGVNGFAPIGTRIFFVVDEPSVPDHRVTSHEIGHLFGLHHDLGDPGRLMFSGTDGEALVEREQLVARYFAEGILDGAR